MVHQFISFTQILEEHRVLKKLKILTLRSDGHVDIMIYSRVVVWDPRDQVVFFNKAWQVSRFIIDSGMCQAERKREQDMAAFFFRGSSLFLVPVYDGIMGLNFCKLRQYKDEI